MKALTTLFTLALLGFLGLAEAQAVGNHYNDFASPPARSSAKKKKGGYVPPPPPTPTPAPSVELAKFVSAHLGRILGPIDKTQMPRPELAQLRSSISSRFSRASLAERPQFQAALNVCDALGKAMDERNKAVVDPIAAANWPTRSAQLKENITQLVAQEKAIEVPATHR